MRVPHPNVAGFATLGWDSTCCVKRGLFSLSGEKRTNLDLSSSTLRRLSTSTPSRATPPKLPPRNTARGTPVQSILPLAAPSTSYAASPADHAPTVSPPASIVPHGASVAFLAAPPSAPKLRPAESSLPTCPPTADGPPPAAPPPPAKRPPEADVPLPRAAAPAPKSFAEPPASRS
jgi:hypothetical protein